ncbi:hypothetical protein Q1695_009061 [Nippostrongylus brasiliensis]|nr:hypothetical protein Q1695_009061 [Nippostrongylus brasiliensis]
MCGRGAGHEAQRQRRAQWPVAVRGHAPSHAASRNLLPSGPAVDGDDERPSNVAQGLSGHQQVISESSSPDSRHHRIVGHVSIPIEAFGVPSQRLLP